MTGSEGQIVTAQPPEIFLECCYGLGTHRPRQTDIVVSTGSSCLPVHLGEMSVRFSSALSLPAESSPSVSLICAILFVRKCRDASRMYCYSMLIHKLRCLTQKCTSVDGPHKFTSLLRLSIFCALPTKRCQNMLDDKFLPVQKRLHCSRPLR